MIGFAGLFGRAVIEGSNARRIRRDRLGSSEIVVTWADRTICRNADIDLGDVVVFVQFGN